MNCSAVISGGPAADFSRRRRLLEAKDFKRVFDENKFRASNQHLLVLAIRHSLPLSRSSRLGIVVSKKSVRRAIDRNRIKRLIREYFRQQVSPLTHSVDFVVLSRPGLNLLDNKNITATLKLLFDNVLRKAGNEKPKKQRQPHEH